MQRRKFLRSAGGGVLAGVAGLASMATAAPLVGTAALPEIKWRLASSFPKSLDTIYGAAETVSQRVAAVTGGKFQIQVFAANELVPGPGVLDAVKDGTVQMGHSASYYYVGKDPTFAFDTAMPFGLNSRQQTAWMLEGGGMPLMRAFFRDYNIYNLPLGNTGAQMGGWYRKEIRTVADLQGLKLRIGGFAGQVLARVGVVPQQIAGDGIYAALEKGAIDAAEWVGPYDDEKLGFSKVAKYYYYPGWWEGGPQLSAYINLKEWERLPKPYQIALEDACLYAHAEMQARYDARNPAALQRLIGNGTQLRPFSNEIMAACYKAALELYAETSAKNPRFAKVYAPWKKFRDEQIEWFSVCEGRFDRFSAATARYAQQQAGRNDLPR